MYDCLLWAWTELLAASTGKEEKLESDKREGVVVVAVDIEYRFQRKSIVGCVLRSCVRNGHWSFVIQKCNPTPKCEPYLSKKMIALFVEPTHPPTKIISLVSCDNEPTFVSVVNTVDLSII
jgi:hypothetical protein